MTQGPGTPHEWDPESGEHRGPVVRDRRRIDPETGAVREGARKPAAPPEPPPAPAGTTGPASDHIGEADSAAEKIAELTQALAERTDDLKRLQAEYVNYKRRVDRDRNVGRELAVAGVLTELLPVVDDIGRAREHGELEGGFKAVAEALESVLNKLGLVRYGEVGDGFDPRIHEALMHSYADDVDGPVCSAILQPGYRHGDRVLRPARVAVAEPTVALPEDATPNQTAAADAADAPDTSEDADSDQAFPDQS